MKKFDITGMTCAACSLRVEKAVSKVEGVSSCSVNLLTNSMTCDGNATDENIISAVEKAGYGAKAHSSNNKKTDKKNQNEFQIQETETKNFLNRLIISVIFILPLMYFSMGINMFGFPVPTFFKNNFVALSLVQFLFCICVMLVNKKFFVSGFKALLNKSANMDTLVSLGSAVSFVWSVFVLFLMTGKTATENIEIQKSLSHKLYFESAAMILVFITLGKTLESFSKGKTTNAIKSLMNLSPKKVTVLQDGKEISVDTDDVKKDDIFIVRPGENIAVDAVVIEGNSSVDESALTGESIPSDKEVSSKVKSGTTNISGFLKCRATENAKNSTLSKIIELVENASATKAPVAKIADKVSGVFVPVIIALSVLTFIVWILLQKDFSFALEKCVSVLVISCPCALGLATPVAIMVSNGVGAKNSILFKNAESLENAGKAQIVVLDKTGTVTKGKMSVTDIEYFDGHAGTFSAVALSRVPGQKAPPLASPTISSPLQSLMQNLLTIEKLSSHPVAKAAVSFFESEGFNAASCENFDSIHGKGVKALIDGIPFFAGNISLIKENCFFEENIISLIQKKIENYSLQGKTSIVLASNETEKKSTLHGIVFLSDTIKDDSVEAIQEFNELGLQVVMLTGDNSQTASKIAQDAGIKNVIANVLPQDKEKVVSLLKKQGKVMMVGDGINDTPALTSADIGVAIGNGTDIAMESASIVLMSSSLKDVASAIELSRKTLRNIHENLFWAFFYNVLCIPLAAGVFIKPFGLSLNPMFAALAMSLSSFCVVTNALRLNLAKIKKLSHHKSAKNSLKNLQLSEIKKLYSLEENKMTKTIKIEGMMCAHCENHVKTALETLDGVESAVVSAKNGEAVVTLSKDVSNLTFENTISLAGYKFISAK